MEFKISIRSSDPHVASEISQAEIDGVKIKQQRIIREIVNPPIDLIVYVGEHVILPLTISLIARLLYDKLKERRDNELALNNQPVEINSQKIEQVIINLTKEKEK